jgi:hypothetical protein
MDARATEERDWPTMRRAFITQDGIRQCRQQLCEAYVKARREKGAAAGRDLRRRVHLGIRIAALHAHSYH